MNYNFAPTSLRTQKTKNNRPAKTIKSLQNILLLFTCEALSRTSNVVFMTVMALTGQALASRKILATLPLALIPVATMLTTLPAARLMRRRGRRFGFALGASLGTGAGGRSAPARCASPLRAPSLG